MSEYVSYELKNSDVCNIFYSYHNQTIFQILVLSIEN